MTITKIKTQLKHLLCNNIFGEKLFVIGLVLLAVALPLSPFLVGASQFLLLLNYIAEKDLKRKWKDIKTHKALLFFLLIFAVHLLGLGYTQNFNYAFHDLKIKLPLLVLPIIFSTSHKLKQTQINIILLFFVLSVVVSSIISFGIYLNISTLPVTNIRQISIFISHIRLALMVVFAVCILFFYLEDNKKDLKKWQYIGLILTIFWLLFFLIVLQSLTGWVVVLFVIYVLIFMYLKQIKPVFKILSLFFVVVLPLLVAMLLYSVTNKYFVVKNVNLKNLPKYTQKGGEYKHNIESEITENGNYVWLYYCPQELNKYWKKYSHINIDSTDKRGQNIRNTLIRYLTSKNLTKDAEGLAKLDKKDVELIEKGYANCVYKSKFIPLVKIHELLWEINDYRQTNNVNGKSILMRREYLKAGWNIFKQHKLLGVGTGDVADMFLDYYKKTKTNLYTKYQLRTHNQYLTFLLTFGIIGFVIIVFSFFKSLQISREQITPLAICFLSIFLLSMFAEDTLETQAGVTFGSYFYALLILSKKNISN